MLSLLSQHRINRFLRSALLISFLLLRSVKNEMMLYADVAIITAFIVLSIAALKDKPIADGPILQQQAETQRRHDIFSIIFGLLVFGFILYSKYW